MLSPEVTKGIEKAAEYRRLSDRLLSQALVDATYDNTGKEALDYYLRLIGMGVEPEHVLWNLIHDVLNMANIRRLPKNAQNKNNDDEEEREWAW